MWNWDSTEPAPCACMMVRGPEEFLHPVAYTLVLVGVAAAVFLAICQIVARRRAREGPDTTSHGRADRSQDDLLVLPARARVLLALMSVVSGSGGIVLLLLS